MNDQHYTDDDRLDARLRSGLAALVAEAPEPPPLPAPGSARRSAARRRPLVLAAAVVVLVVAVAAVVAARRDDGGQQLDGRVDRPLVGTTWVLTEASSGSRDVPIPDDATLTLRLSPCSGAACPDLRIDASLGCGILIGQAINDDGRLRVSLANISGCPDTQRDPLGELLRRALIGGLRVARSGESLRLEDDGDVLVYRAATSAGVAALRDTDWSLVDATQVPRVVDGNGEGARLSFRPCTEGDCRSALAVSGHDGCNEFAGTAWISTGRFHTDRDGQPSITSTAIGCSDDLPPLVTRVLRGGTIELLDGELHLVSSDGDVVLRYRRARAELPPLEGMDLDTGAGDGVVYRLSWARIGDALELRFEHASAFRTMSALMAFLDRTDAPEDPRLENSTVTHVEQVLFYAWGIVPPDAVRVVAEVGGRRIAIPTFDLEGLDGTRAFGARFGTGPDRLLALDASGRVVARTR